MHEVLGNYFMLTGYLGFYKFGQLGYFPALFIFPDKLQLFFLLPSIRGVSIFPSSQED